MKKILPLLLMALIMQSATGIAQNKPCKEFYVDLASGTLNKVSPKASMNAVKKKLPCFTGESEEGSDFNCGGGVFYLKDDFFFYTGKDYIEIRSNFKGKLSQDVMGKDIPAIEKLFGTPAMTLNEHGDKIYLYKQTYGTLRVTFGRDLKVKQLGIHGVSPAQVELCY